jgi:hypothetical protein
MRATIPMTDEQKFVFDLKGWIAIPGVLTEEETSLVRDHVLALKGQEPDNRYPDARWDMPSQMLLDHPVIVGVLGQIIGADRSDSSYGFRCESVVPSVRSTDYEGLDPHGGASVGALSFNCVNGKLYSGLTRVVWELNPVEEGDGGTLFMSGSHKANFTIPEAHLAMDSPLFESYTCPAGSVVIFSESVCHAGPLWTNAERHRISIFSAYGPTQAQYHKTNLSAAVIETMPPKRQTLFRGAWVRDFKNAQANDYFSAENVAM